MVRVTRSDRRQAIGNFLLPTDAAVDENLSNWRHFPALDGIRGVAILLVLLHHLMPIRIEGLPSWWQSLFRSGWIGVDLFFVLSGFLITGILVKSRRGRHRFRNFYARRSLRIFPLYFGSLAAILYGVPAVLEATNIRMPGIEANIDAVAPKQWYLWTYTQNLVAERWYMFNHFWSLAVEEQFYLIWPALVFLLGPNRTAKLCLIIIPVAFIIRVVLRECPQLGLNPYIFTAARFDSLAIGGWASIIWLAHGDRAVRSARRLLPWATLSTATLLWAIRNEGHGSFWVETFGFPLLALWGGALVLASVGPAGRIGNVLQRRTLRTIGKYSYGMYVIHRLIQGPVLMALPVSVLSDVFGRPEIVAVSIFLISSGVTFVAALISWHAFEKHFLDLKGYFTPIDHPTPRTG